MHSYSVRDVERVLRLSRSTIRGLIDVGFVKPARGPRREYRFSFQDLIVLRAARALIQAKVSRRRIRRSLEDLRRHLPETVPLSGLSICAVGDHVVVRDGKAHWQVDSGQYLLGLDVSVENGMLRVVERQEADSAVARQRPLPRGAGEGQGGGAAQRAVGKGQAGGAGQRPLPRAAGEGQGGGAAPEDWFEDALELEASDPRAALLAYERAVKAEPENVAAWINWGRLLHEQGRKREAEGVYRRAQEQCGPDSVLMFNLGVLLEDLGRTGPAIEAYQAAIGEDPNLADCHYNLARLYESLGQPQHAIRHLGQYRRLVTETR